MLPVKIRPKAKSHGTSDTKVNSNLTHRQDDLKQTTAFHSALQRVQEVFKLVPGDFRSVFAMQHIPNSYDNDDKLETSRRTRVAGIHLSGANTKPSTHDNNCRWQQLCQRQWEHCSQFRFALKQNSSSTAHLPNPQAAQVQTPAKRLV
jgi:hypothetical protein